MNPRLPTLVIHLSIVAIVLCCLLCAQTVYISVTSPVQQFTSTWANVLSSMLQLVPAIPAVMLLRKQVGLLPQWLAWSSFAYLILFFISVVNLLFIAQDPLSAGLPIVLIIWPLAIILSILLLVVKQRS